MLGGRPGLWSQQQAQGLPTLNLPRGLKWRTSSTTYCWKKGCARASSAVQRFWGCTTKKRET